MEKITLEAQKPFSKSLIWKLQRDYFDKQGINAWVSQVPYFVTSNCYIAKSYAYLTLAFIKDWILEYPESKKDPFYIIELGTGSGCLSFYIIKKLQTLKQILGLQDIQIRYVMTDFTSNNIKYWQNHSKFQPYLEANQLDFAVYNLEDEKQSLHLIRANKDLTSKTLKNPPVIFANYIFDTISHDAFHIKDNELSAVEISLQTDQKGIKNGQRFEKEHLEIQFHNKKLSGPFYKDQTFEIILQEHAKQLNNGSFLIPIGALKTIKKLYALTEGKFFMLSTDKAHAHLDEMENRETPHIAFHASFSLMVNYHAIKRYIELLSGSAYVQLPHVGIQTIAGGCGFSLNEFKKTKNAISKHVEHLSPANYFILYGNLTRTDSNMSFEAIVSCLKFSEYDPAVFNKLFSRISNGIKTASAINQKSFLNILPNIADNFYEMPKSVDTYFNIALCYHWLELYELALKYYQLSEKHQGENYNIIYNYGLCHYYLDKKEKALHYFEQALKLNPSSKNAKDWFEYVQKELRG